VSTADETSGHAIAAPAGQQAGRQRAGHWRAGHWRAEHQRWLAVAALLLAIACLVPPVSSLAGRYVFVETIQFTFFAIVVPGLLVLSAPWQLLRLSRRDSPTGRSADGEAGPDSRSGPADRLASGRQRQPLFRRSVAFLVAFAAVAVFWRLPPVVDAVARHQGLAVAEMASLLITGVALWLEIAASPPLRPRGQGLHRAIIAACAMWVIWISAYILGLATHGVFHAFRYVPGGPLSAVADQELATAVMWGMAFACFMPVIWLAAHSWLGDSENADSELERAADSGALPAVKGWGQPRRRKTTSSV